MGVPVSGEAGIPLFYDWIRYAIMGDIVLVVEFQPSQAISLPLLDSGCPVGLYNKEHKYADARDNIIHTYVRLIQIRIQQSDGNLYIEQTKDRPFWWAPI